MELDDVDGDGAEGVETVPRSMAEIFQISNANRRRNREKRKLREESAQEGEGDEDEEGEAAAEPTPEEEEEDASRKRKTPPEDKVEFMRKVSFYPLPSPFTLSPVLPLVQFLFYSIFNEAPLDPILPFRTLPCSHVGNLHQVLLICGARNCT
jgi:hypothetical protein